MSEQNLEESVRVEADPTSEVYRERAFTAAAIKDRTDLFDDYPMD